MVSKMIGELLRMSRLFRSSNASSALLFLPCLIISALPLCPSASLFPSSPTMQNKCVRYWPDLHGTKEFGKVLVRNVDERPAQDYILRKLEVTRLDRVRRMEGWGGCRMVGGGLGGNGYHGLNQSRPTDPGSDYLALMRTHTILRLALTRGSRAAICVRAGGGEEKKPLHKSTKPFGVYFPSGAEPWRSVEAPGSAFLRRIRKQFLISSATFKTLLNATTKNARVVKLSVVSSQQSCCFCCCHFVYEAYRK